jgi:hypothetical protein
MAAVQPFGPLQLLVVLDRARRIAAEVAQTLRAALAASPA